MAPTIWERIDQIPWGDLRHAHGAATDVPALIRSLASPSQDTRLSALQDLFETIWHQGDIFPATAKALPFLFDLLALDGVEDKQNIAVLIATITEGEPPQRRVPADDMERAKWEEILHRSGRSLEKETEEGRAAVEEIRDVMTDRVQELAPFLRHPDAEVRMAIVRATSLHPPTVPLMKPHLREAGQHEPDQELRELIQSLVESDQS